jgi:hypothetical protein
LTNGCKKGENCPQEQYGLGSEDDEEDGIRRVETTKNRRYSSITETIEEKGLSVPDLKKECFEYARQAFQGKKFTSQQPPPKAAPIRGLDTFYDVTVFRLFSISCFDCFPLHRFS